MSVFCIPADSQHRRRTRRLSRIRPVSTMCTSYNTCFLRPTRVVGHLDRFNFAHLTAECRRACPRGQFFPVKISPSHRGSRPHQIMLSWALPSSQPKVHLDQFSRFCTVHRRLQRWNRVRIFDPVTRPDPVVERCETNPRQRLDSSSSYPVRKPKPSSSLIYSINRLSESVLLE